MSTVEIVGARSGYLVVAGVLLAMLMGTPAGGVYGVQGLRYPPGIIAETPPQQTQMQPPEHWISGDYRISAVARYEVRARAVASHEYWFDRESDLAPLDFVLAWGPASDQSVQDAISVNVWGRSYRWSARSKNLALSPKELSEHMANTHLIPSSKAVLNSLRNVQRGSVVTLRGYLVNVEADDGFHWTSSLSRSDSGTGSCELLWVESVELS